MLLLWIKAPQRSSLGAAASDSHLHPQLFLEIADQIGVEIFRVELRGSPHFLRSGLQLREEVPVALDEIADLLGRKMGKGGAGELFIIRRSARQVLRRFPRALVGPAQPPREPGLPR